MQSREHWDRAYAVRGAAGVSWYQEHAGKSLAWIRDAAPDPRSAIIDVGGGASTLVDGLLETGYRKPTVIDLSETALALSRDRLGGRAALVDWLAGDVTQLALPAQAFDVWHDRAVFHFLTQQEERQAYLNAVGRALRPGGAVIVATFAQDGPDRCSGLPVARYGPAGLHAAFGPAFALLRHDREAHRTPAGTIQHFTWCMLRMLPDHAGGLGV